MEDAFLLLQLPKLFTMGCFTKHNTTPGSDGTWYWGLIAGREDCRNRITHNSLNKDTGMIDPKTAATWNPTSDRGKVGSNFDISVKLAIKETKQQWQNFTDAMISRYGTDMEALMICAMTSDKPWLTCGDIPQANICDGQEKDLTADPNNCGACGVQVRRQKLIYVPARELTGP